MTREAKTKEKQKKAQLTPKEKRKLKKEKRLPKNSHPDLAIVVTDDDGSHRTLD